MSRNIIELNDDELEVVNSFNFLGSLISEDGNCKKEIVRRIGIGKSSMKRMGKIWKDRDININTKIQLVKSVIFPAILYGAETWTMVKETRKRLQAAEMWCWRRLLRIRWIDRVSNEEVLRRVGEPATIPLDGISLKLKLNYFGHIRRGDTMEKEIMLGMIGGSRRRGRPRIRWMDEIKEAAGQTLEQLLHCSKNRSAWRRQSLEIARSRPRLGGTR